MSESLEGRVARQFSSLYITLVSVLVGLVLADLFAEIHARMRLWPLTVESLRTWCQILGNMLAVLAAWVIYSHLGLLRNRLPSIWDSIDAALVLVTVPLNAATGRHDGAPWFFWAGAYCVLGLCAIRINVWQATQEPALRHIPRLARLGGPLTGLWLGGPAYFLAAALSARRLLPPVAELVIASTATVSVIVVTIWFMREWRQAVLRVPEPA